MFLSFNQLFITKLIWCNMNMIGQVFFSRKSCKTYENTVESPKSPYHILIQLGWIGVFAEPVLAPGP